MGSHFFSFLYREGREKEENIMSFQIKSIPRKGAHDMWNAFMVEGATFTQNDIPICKSSAIIPEGLISFDKAKTLYNKNVKKNPDFKDNRFVHFYIDDQKFDGKENGIWVSPFKALEILMHYKGIITPDFSTNCDFPMPYKLINTYRMRAFGYWAQQQGVETINNVRWGTEETWSYCFDGIPKGSAVAIGTVASGLRRKENRKLFDDGLMKMLEEIEPKTIIIYGSANYPVIKKAKENGVAIISFPSQTSLAFTRGKINE